MSSTETTTAAAGRWDERGTDESVLRGLDDDRGSRLSGPKSVSPVGGALRAAPPLPRRRLPVGAEPVEGGVHVRVWAPDHQRVEMAIAGDGKNAAVRVVALEGEDGGYFSALVSGAAAGCCYGFRLDGEETIFSDPASRFQPDGPEGLSQVIDPSTFAWTDHDWQGVGIEGQVIYEAHIGALTPGGTWRSAIAELPALAALGVTVIEVMPLADFSGAFGWGYDGVNLFAPTRLYGTPDDCRAFIDAAHAHGIAVILDVVYNHLGPIGNVLASFAADYFTDQYQTDWGKPLNFDQANCEPVREFFIYNARYWIEEFHFDGLRIDATQNIYDFDDSHEHILAAVTRAAREAAGTREIIVIAENEPQDVRLLRSFERGGFGMDGMWNDDLHHAAMVALTGRKEAYYTDYHGNPQEFVSAAKYGFLYQGQRYKWQNGARGTPTLGLSPVHFVTFLQNHDQVANSGGGYRIHKLTSPGRLRAMTAYILLLPGTPMLFMGQEFAASSPFLYFADHPDDLAAQVDAGRREFLQQFPSLATAEMQQYIAVPADPATFERCKLDPRERETNAEVVRLHTDLLRMRREQPVFTQQRLFGVDGACLGQGAFVLRYFDDSGEGDDRLMLINLETDLHLDPAPEPLLAPPLDRTWEVAWSSEDPAYGGSGTPPIYSLDKGWLLPGWACIIMRPAAIPAAASDDEEDEFPDVQLSGEVPELP